MKVAKLQYLQLNVKYALQKQKKFYINLLKAGYTSS